MKEKLSELFAYPSRTEILETLFYQPGELGLRQIAAVANVYVRSAELALEDLRRARLVRRRRRGYRVMFALNRRHSAYPLIRDVFTAAEARRIKDRAESDRNAGRDVLSFVVAALDTAEKARRSLAVEDVIIAKLSALKHSSQGFKDLDDLSSIFGAKPELNIKYLVGQMKKLDLVVPRNLAGAVPDEIAKVSRDVEKDLRARRGKIAEH